MSNLASAIVMVAVGLAAAAPALKVPAKGQETIVGDWVVERVTYDGEAPADDGGGGRYVFRADGTWSYFGRDGKEHGGIQRDFRADPTASPPTMDLMYGKPRPDRRTELGIYKLDGDTLTLCYRVGPGDRPSTFESGEGGQMIFLAKLKRVKPSK